MVKNHLSRLNAPKSWPLKRKGIKFVTRPSAGPHSLKESTSLSLVLTNILKYARTRKEVKKILNDGKILVNGKLQKDHTFPIGLLDIISIPSLNEYYRVFYNTLGKFQLLALKEEESDLRVVRIKDKSVIAYGKIQLNNTDGSNIILDKNAYATGDTLFLSFKDGKIKEHLTLGKGMRVYMTGGTKRGVVATVEEFKDKNIIIKTDGEIFETAKRYALAIGKLRTLEQ
ncbi:30S ribosomal protein S4e [Candidatus Woesearchaeota archaeon]|nr:30S ribosomal protein S4e [Candidatus Woesearchaeota archaeon]